jgi:predicted Ser/Thr protein kinase
MRQRKTKTNQDVLEDIPPNPCGKLYKKTNKKDPMEYVRGENYGKSKTELRRAEGVSKDVEQTN